LDFFSFGSGGFHSGSFKDLKTSSEGWLASGFFLPFTRSEKSSVESVSFEPGGPKNATSNTT
jgi:hypothetical protein